MYFIDIRKLWLKQITEYQTQNPVEWHDLGVYLKDDFRELNASTFSLKSPDLKEDMLHLEINSTISTYAHPTLHLRSNDHDWWNFFLDRYNDSLHKFFWRTEVRNVNLKKKIHPVAFKICTDILHFRFTFVRPSQNLLRIHAEFECKVQP